MDAACSVIFEEMTARAAQTHYKSSDDSEKLFRDDKSYLGNRTMRLYLDESTSAKLFIEFVALIIKNNIYTSLKLGHTERQPNGNTRIMIDRIPGFQHVFDGPFEERVGHRERGFDIVPGLSPIALRVWMVTCRLFSFCIYSCWSLVEPRWDSLNSLKTWFRFKRIKRIGNPLGPLLMPIGADGLHDRQHL